MHRTVAIAIGCIVLALTWASLSRNRPADAVTTPSDPDTEWQSSARASGGGWRPHHNAIAVPEQTMLSEEVEQPDRDDSNEAPEDLAEMFETFASATADNAAQGPRITLDQFERPYSMTMTEAAFAQLSSEDKSIAIDEIADALREARREASDTYAQADADIAGGNYDRAETALVGEYERTSRFNANEEGLYFTRIMGVGYQQRTLKRLETLYTRTGDHRKLQRTQQQWQDLEAEKRRMQTAQIEQAG